MDGSPVLSLGSVDYKKVLVGAGVAVVGALLTYASQWASGVDFGAWTPIVVAFLSVLTNLARKYLTDTTSGN